MFRFVLISLTLNATLLVAAPQPQPFRQPLLFEPNWGQAPPEVTWLARGPGYQLFLTRDGLTMTVQEGPAPRLKDDVHLRSERRLSDAERPYSVVNLKLSGSLPWSNVVGQEPTGGVSNYLVRPNAKGSLTQIPHYARVSIPGVYKGIDLVLYSRDGNLEYDFVVAPGADPKQIQLTFNGTKEIRVDEKSGDLILTTIGGSELRHARPSVYQQLAERRAEVAGGYQLLDRQRVAFSLAGYDRQHSLVIDPTVSFMTSFGYATSETVYAVAVDSVGNSYVTGQTNRRDFPVTNGSKWMDEYCDSSIFPPYGFCSPTGYNIFVAKLSPTGALLFATFGGVGNGNAIAVDSTGVYVTGAEYRPDRDNVIGFAGGSDIFVLKLSLDGDFIYGNTFGTEKDDAGTAIAVDSQHNAWIAGWSDGFGPRTAVDIIKVGPTGLYLGGTPYGSAGNSKAYGIAVDPADQPWITGQTCGGGFSVTNSATVGPDSSPLCKAFVLQLEGPGTTPHVVTRMSMVFGGSDAGDAGYAIVPNGSNAAYVTGVTNASNFPTTLGAYQTAKLSAGPSAFIAEVDDASYTGRIVRSTLLGGSVDTVGHAIASTGAVYVGGYIQGAPDTGFIQKLKFDLTQSSYTKTLASHVHGLAVLGQAATGAPEIYAGGNDTTYSFVAKLDDDPRYSSLRFADVNGDGRPDICGRGAAGVSCALNNGNGTFNSIQQWDFFFSDANSWYLPEYGTTMMFADINGDGKADACARGIAGIWCSSSVGTSFGTTSLVQTDFSDANGWNKLDYYASLRFADVNGDGKPDICGRGAAGVYCALNNGNGRFGSVRLWDSFFSDTNSWQLLPYGTTMMFADINGGGRADACARGIAGIWCESSAGTSFEASSLVQTDFSDADGWLQLYGIAP